MGNIVLNYNISNASQIPPKATADADELGRQIDQLNGELQGLQSDLDEATKIREEENAEYNKVNQDYGESVDAIGRALAVLKSRGAGERKEMKSRLLRKEDCEELVYEGTSR
jgi:hypothetical protein